MMVWCAGDADRRARAAGSAVRRNPGRKGAYGPRIARAWLDATAATPGAALAQYEDRMVRRLGGDGSGFLPQRRRLTNLRGPATSNICLPSVSASWCPSGSSRTRRQANAECSARQASGSWRKGGRRRASVTHDFDTLEIAMRKHLVEALALAHGNQRQAAVLLGVSRWKLARLVKRFELRDDDAKRG